MNEGLIHNGPLLLGLFSFEARTLAILMSTILEISTCAIFDS